ncbi:ssDNA-binding domain-containing protein (plasmid) [Ensifer adhaerens]|uniref:ArdC family protein n=1 Tax=Ensifer adhaerens TaxID=106592 RepID=UPI001CBE11C6|nr:zincin-like metallopeptidase domain-containing protein [Ensifer adhaerens]MBZ7927605.1 ssDNA-binding domain-containing protein [Ensifer adhaerens]UAX98009.1 ssDNA-binding domain-containing protein [Ensifer adhaerens]UAY05389.1 ssDNA-binding domain-containing protein [Ensifer adhaerens]UAY12767.1 ssDNA-binding domain-containing protein [Ensifer adhaerens]
MTKDRNHHTPTDIYERVTSQIIAAIEAGAGDYRMPWHHDGSAITTPVNVASSKAYRGINILSLWAAAHGAGYPAGIWGTYRQWQALDAQVRKGERGHLVVFWKTTDHGADAQHGDEDRDEPARRLFARGYTVFNCAQVDGYTPPVMPVLAEAERIDRAERFCAALGIDIRHGGSQAYYRPATDQVQMPRFACFRDAVAYYAVLLHECGHASGARHRLDRDLSGRFGSAAYAMEECTVELLSAMICADLNLSVEPRPDHARYIASWLEVLRADARAIFTAASKAQQIADWMHAQAGARQHEVRGAA